ncbi:hypothetical protein OG552_10555 [Streptomyces sp. NBC_01476]|uniref:hypothetical protein n=1 Tax=Streptomyces sp. NBC_01476 TaxID=2903881 RepID=UPI002E358014|nr:hypothetical protein [Streptomyces sp. NBC_01476]
MSFPDGLPTTLLTYAATNPAGGDPAEGTVRLEPNVPAITVEGFGRVFSGAGTYRFNDDGDLVDAEGNVGVRVLPNDVPGTNPRGWLWLVTETIGGKKRSYYMAVSADQEEAELDRQQQVDPSSPQYVPVVGPRGPQGEQGEKGDTGEPGGGGTGTPSSTVVAQTAFGASSTAGSASDYSRGDHAHGTPTAPTLAGLGGLAKASNLSDVASVAAARTNLGLGTAAVQPASAFDTAGSAASAQSAATSAAATDATAKVAAHTASNDPHGDRAAAGDALAAHAADSTNIHGITDTAALETGAGSTAKVAAHASATDPHGDRVWAGGQFDTLGAANAAQAAAESYTDNAITGEADRADIAYDSAGAAAAAQTAAQGYADDGDAETLTAANAYTDSHAGGSGGGITSVADDRIDEEIIVLVNAPAWTLVTTSGGIIIGKSVPASAGDRVWVSPSFMYAGTQYQLDLAVMKGDGSGVSRYASSSGTSGSPGPEGYAPFYTQATSFPHASGITQFIVDASEVDGGGNFTVNLAYSAPSLSGVDNKIYAGGGYLGRWLMANIG